MRKRDKTCAKATPEEPKREQRMVCLMSEEELRIDGAENLLTDFLPVDQKNDILEGRVVASIFQEDGIAVFGFVGCFRESKPDR